MSMNGSKSKSPHEDRERASAFYKKVLKWHSHNGQGGKASRQAAIGLPVAMKTDKVREHIYKFIENALADGMPKEVLLAMVEELQRELKQTERCER